MVELFNTQIASLGAFFIPLLVAVGTAFKKTAPAKLHTFTPIIVLIISFIMVYLYNSGWAANMNISQTTFMSIVFALSAVSTYEIGKIAMKQSADQLPQ